MIHIWKESLHAGIIPSVCVEEAPAEDGESLEYWRLIRKIIITEDLIKRHMDENGVEWVNVYDFLRSEEL